MQECPGGTLDYRLVASPNPIIISLHESESMCPTDERGRFKVLFEKGTHSRESSGDYKMPPEEGNHDTPSSVILLRILIKTMFTFSMIVKEKEYSTALSHILSILLLKS